MFATVATLVRRENVADHDSAGDVTMEEEAEQEKHVEYNLDVVIAAFSIILLAMVLWTYFLL